MAAHRAKDQPASMSQSEFMLSKLMLYEYMFRSSFAGVTNGSKCGCWQYETQDICGFVIRIPSKFLEQDTTPLKCACSIGTNTNTHE